MNPNEDEPQMNTNQKLISADYTDYADSGFGLGYGYADKKSFPDRSRFPRPGMAFEAA
jgi:hypothetical protein